MSKDEARSVRILAAALKLIAHYGFDKTTVDDIAREAGVSKGAVYLHWPSKDALFEALIWRETWDYLNHWLELVEADPLGGTLAGIFTNAIRLLMERPLLRAIYNQDLRVMGDYLKRRDPILLQRRFMFGQEFIQMMQREGMIRPEASVKQVSYLFACLSQGLLTVNSFIPKEDIPTIEQFMQTISDVLTAYLVAPNITLDQQLHQSEIGKRMIRAVIEQYRTIIPKSE